MTTSGGAAAAPTGYKKDFDGWHEEKKLIEAGTPSHGGATGHHYKAREVWWCSLGTNVGEEHDGTGDNYDRPVLVLMGFTINSCLIVPLTTSLRDHRLRPSVGIVGGKAARALLSQIRVIDRKRLIKKIQYLDQTIFDATIKAVKDML
jgi:mRNA-degrading endonuclease toxin of MazEF toxin-antitoxin module